MLSKHLELISLIKSQAVTIEEKFKVLDARDKLIRIQLKKKTKLKSGPTIGTCPDMCPEKERLMRETKHQVWNILIVSNEKIDMNNFLIFSIGCFI